MFKRLYFYIIFAWHWIGSFVNAYQFNKNYLNYLKKVYQNGDHEFMLAGQPCVLLTNPEDIRKFYKDHIGIRVEGFSESMKILIGNNIITASNEQHPVYRSRYLKHFNGSQLIKYSKMMKRVIELYPVPNKFMIQDYVKKIAGLCAISAFSDIDPSQIEPSLANDILIVFDNIRQNMITYRKIIPQNVIDARNRVYSFIESLIPQYTNTETVLGEIINYCTETYPDIKECEQRICEELFSLFIGGSETTVSLLSWACYYLTIHPEIQTRLKQELDGRLPEYSDKDKYPYLNKFITELLRVKSPTGLGCLKTVENVKMSSFTIFPDTLVFVCPLITHVDSQYWLDSQLFDPDRHTSYDDLTGKYFPFGMFHYYCLGKEFSKHETRLLIASILRLPQSLNIDSINDEVDLGFTVRPKTNFEVTLIDELK